MQWFQLSIILYPYIKSHELKLTMSFNYVKIKNHDSSGEG